MKTNMNSRFKFTSNHDVLKWTKRARRAKKSEKEKKREKIIRKKHTLAREHRRKIWYLKHVFAARNHYFAQFFSKWLHFRNLTNWPCKHLFMLTCIESSSSSDKLFIAFHHELFSLQYILFIILSIISCFVSFTRSVWISFTLTCSLSFGMHCLGLVIGSNLTGYHFEETKSEFNDDSLSLSLSR